MTIFLFKVTGLLTLLIAVGCVWCIYDSFKNDGFKPSISDAVFFSIFVLIYLGLSHALFTTTEQNLNKSQKESIEWEIKRLESQLRQLENE